MSKNKVIIPKLRVNLAQFLEMGGNLEKLNKEISESKKDIAFRTHGSIVESGTYSNVIENITISDIKNSNGERLYYYQFKNRNNNNVFRIHHVYRNRSRGLFR